MKPTIFELMEPNVFFENLKFGYIVTIIDQSTKWSTFVSAKNVIGKKPTIYCLRY